MVMAVRVFLLFAFFMKAILAAKKITTLPGFTGELPFPLESGYVGVGDNEEVQLFYLYAESINNPEEDPVLLWNIGGPGCSSIVSLFYENGPLKFDIPNYNWDGSWSLPTLLPNEYAWTQNISIIYLDAPAGAGFSYATSTEGWLNSDVQFGKQLDQFLRKWFLEHPKVLNNPLYLGGDGYVGMQYPIAMQNILDGNDIGSEPVLNLKGYMMGNPGADFDIDFNSQYTFAHRLALIPDELYEEAYSNCNGNFTNPPNTKCSDNVDAMKALTSNINTVQVVEPACKNLPAYLTLKAIDNNSARRFLKEEYERYLSYELPLIAPTTHWCRLFNRELCYIWANDETVQQALDVKGANQGMSFAWKSCNDSIIVGPAYSPKVQSVVDYHKRFTENNQLRGLIFSGDHDMEIPYIGTQKWIEQLGMALVQKWSVWSVDNETAGYVRKFSSDAGFNLTFATVKGGGHYPPEYKVKECFELVKRWLVNDTVTI